MSYDNPRFGRHASGEEIREIIEDLEVFIRRLIPGDNFEKEARRIIDRVHAGEISPEHADHYLAALYDEADRRQNEG